MDVFITDLAFEEVHNVTIIITPAPSNINVGAATFSDNAPIKYASASTPDPTHARYD